ncbi:putative bifunctional diguanylate cyclase/phosphodiesterase [Phytohabitans kaempferiae]|uniref:Bifunctional diguanylate cyclase/phosphodiesterase n=1 Tax=Phytohabitans kaempferiae TaxID=1620943 RepID=A0ABV6MA45_9ACTN
MVGALVAVAALSFVGRDGVVFGAPAAAYVPWVVLAGVAAGMSTEVMSATAAVVSTGAAWRDALRAGWASRLTVRAGQILLALLVTAMVAGDRRLLLLLPLVLLVGYAARMHRIAVTGERRAWERLAMITDAFHVADSGAAARTAARGAIDWFGAEAVEVQWADLDGDRVVRATADGVEFDGRPGGDERQARNRQWTVQAIVAGQGTGELGTLRMLTFDRRMLTDRHARALGIFCAALGTSIETALGRKRATIVEAQLTYEATHDPMTGLANRRRLLSEASRLLSSGRTALWLLDLTGFKAVNDTFGHEAGDRLLVAVAARLRQAATVDGQLVARLGGDEFAVLFAGLSAEAATHRARQIHAAVCQSAQVDGVQIPIRGSAGLAVTSGGIDVSELLRRADVAMYQAKRAGRALTVFDPDNDTADALNLELAVQFPDAVAAGHIEVRYEPIIRLATGDIVAARATPVWRHPQRGVLPTATWWTVAAQYHAHSFTKVLLRQALAALKFWRARGHPVQVEVAVAPASINDPRFPVMVLAELAQHRLNPATLIIDVPSAPVGPEPVLDKLDAAGVKFVLDRFGSAASSLALLDAIPFAGLRIDQSLISRLGERKATAIVKGTIRLGQDLTMAVCAEGLDKPETRQVVLDLGCPFGHGPLFGSPLSADELERRLSIGVAGVPRQLGPHTARSATAVDLRAS